MPLRQYVVKRSVTALITFFFCLCINFILPRVVGGNPVAYMAGGVRLSSPEAAERIVQQFGLDKPLYEQFIIYLMNTFRGNLGVSFEYYPRTVLSVMMSRLPWTLFLMGTATVLEVIIGIFLGIAAGWKSGSKTDISTEIVSLIFWATPSFWLGMLLLLLFAFFLPIFPIGFAFTFGASYSNIFGFIADVLYHAILPIITLTLFLFAGTTLVMRNSMGDVLGEDYMLTAEAKGLSERRIKYWHAARNALLPTATNVATQIGLITGGAVLVETVFSYPGLGQLIYQAVNMRDYPVIQGCFLIFAIFVILSNFVVDILYARLDPRIMS